MPEVLGAVKRAAGVPTHKLLYDSTGIRREAAVAYDDLIDLLLEARDGQVIAIEVKASAVPSHTDARHLEWLAAEIGPRFTLGLLVHTGPRVFQLTERILAVPAAGLWSSS
ncbi:hypothetical protein [Frankia sp. Cas3]|uniref:hypothetical protein n=1 Tax=Frankia sp. Cas3 TaxID=3073926 RepID=UPI002AD3C79D|nr:hypothetical protein [Frankia sp. Cas3]